MNTKRPGAPVGPSRRQMLSWGLAGAGMLVADRFGLAAAPATAPRPLQARAKSVIQIWMWGGPCHLDTFDPKPEAGHDYCGPLDKPIETNVAGIADLRAFAATGESRG